MRLDRNAMFYDMDEYESISGSIEEYPTHPHSGFGQLLDVFLTL